MYAQIPSWVNRAHEKKQWLREHTVHCEIREDPGNNISYTEITAGALGLYLFLCLLILAGQ